MENSYIYKEINNITPKIHYKIKETPDYSIKVLEPTLSMKTANYIIFEKIIEANIKKIFYKIKNSRGDTEEKTMTIVPKKTDISIRKSLLIYVPIWMLEISQNQ